MSVNRNFELVWPQLRMLSNASTTSGSSGGEAEKVVAMVVLGFGSFLSGMLPAIISERNRQRFPLTTSLMLCFGAGILLATALVHILPEVRRQMSSNWAEISLCGGFFIIYFIDEFIHFFFGEAIQHTHTTTPASTTTSAASHITHNQYGSLAEDESEPLLHAHNASDNQLNGPVPKSASAHNHGHRHIHCDDATVADANERICHTSHREPCSQLMTGTFGLFVALSLHSAIEGLAIGVQDSSAKVLFLLGAVACHKFVMGFCLGLEFRTNPRTHIRAQLIGISVFALGAVCGIGVGMLIVDMPSNWSTKALPIVQGLAGGTLLYVTVCEVIPREKARWHQSVAHKGAGFTQFLAVASGFATMCVINFYLSDS